MEIGEIVQVFLRFPDPLHQGGLIQEKLAITLHEVFAARQVDLELGKPIAN